MSLLWSKPGVKVDAAIQDFLAGDDVILDREFMLYDIEASMVQANSLQRVGILTEEEVSAIHGELDQLAKDFQSGAFVLDATYEDMHSAIEDRLIERLGDVGRKIHTGRSRNDQVLVATRLWLRDQLHTLLEINKEIASVALDRAQAEAMQPIAGFTHLQRAMVSSLGMWWGAWAEGFIDNAVRARDTLNWINANPLGSASGYGVNIALDRHAATAELGFGRTQLIATYAQLSRGKFEIGALDALGAAVLDLRRLSWDLSLYASHEYGYVSLPAQYTTGSSLMPNKRNPDVIELMRATYAAIAAARVEIEQTVSLPSGYHRDLQFTKGAIVHGFHRGMGALKLLPDLLRNLEWNSDRMIGTLDDGLYATDVAVEFSAQGMPFRDAYKKAADPSLWSGRDPHESVAQRTSAGGAGNLQLEVLRERLSAL